MLLQHVGRYEIREMLGQGGMGTVYRAYDPYFEREVAIKILPREFLHDPSFRARFEREAKTIGALEHPAIVPVHDFGEENGQPYLVMRLMSGGSLADRISEGPLSLAETARITERIASALHAAHEAGIIHRDLKPGNILFDRQDNPYIADFGIVKLTESTSVLTGSGIVGTPSYMAPEMARLGGLTPLVDIYALGVTLFQMLTGRLPFEADTPAGMIMAHIGMPVPDPRDFRPDLPPGVVQVIECALAKEPEHRYQSAADLAADLAASASGAALESTLPDTPPEGTRTRTRRPIAIDEPAETQAEAVQVPPTPAPVKRRAALRPFRYAGLAAGGLVILAAVLFATRNLPIAARPAATPTVELETTAEPSQGAADVLPVFDATQPVSPTPVSLQPVTQILYGVSEAQPAGQTAFMAMAGNQPLNAGDTIRTGDGSAVLLNFGPGVSAELHPASVVSLERLIEADGVLSVALSQASGTTYHFIHPVEGALPVEYSVSTPVAAATATGTEFWVIESADGWCFLPTEGSIEVDLGERDADLNDNYLARASDGDGWLVSPDGTASPCSPDPGRTPLTDGSILLGLGQPNGTPTEEPTPTRPPSAGGGSAGVCGNGVCEAGENSDLCSADCRCIDNGTCEAGEGSGCRDCGASAGTCGAPCTTSAQCGGGLACASGVCWDACTCQGICGGGGGPTAAPGCGACGDGGPVPGSGVEGGCYPYLCMLPNICCTYSIMDSCGNVCGTTTGCFLTCP